MGHGDGHVDVHGVDSATLYSQGCILEISRALRMVGGAYIPKIEKGLGSLWLPGCPGPVLRASQHPVPFKGLLQHCGHGSCFKMTSLWNPWILLIGWGKSKPSAYLAVFLMPDLPDESDLKPKRSPPTYWRHNGFMSAYRLCLRESVRKHAWEGCSPEFMRRGGQGNRGRLLGREGRPTPLCSCLHQRGCHISSWKRSRVVKAGSYIAFCLLSTHLVRLPTCRGEDSKGTLSKLHHRNPTKETDFKSRKKDLWLQGPLWVLLLA